MYAEVRGNPMRPYRGSWLRGVVLTAFLVLGLVILGFLDPSRPGVGKIGPQHVSHCP
jgi:hypothetical protein